MAATRRHSLRFLVLAATLVAAVAVAAPWSTENASAAGVTAIRFNINPVADDTVASDAKADSTSWQYADYRWSALPESCVDAQETSRAFVFIVLNRKFADGSRCSPSPTVDGLARQVVVQIADPVACGHLASYDPAYVVNQTANGCQLNGADNLRVRVENLYAPKLPTTTAVAFLITSFVAPAGHGGFEIKSDTNAPVQGTSTVRTVAYTGTARLHKFSSGIGGPGGNDKPQVVGSPFPLRLHMVFERRSF
jgi:hypothetical protein